MSLKTKQIIKNFIKITTLSLAFILWFLIINNFLHANEKIKIKTEPNNNANYKNIIINPIANVWVAITSNIWMWLNKENKIKEENINNKIFKAEDFYKNSNNIKQKIITTNMLFTKEYFNILKMDFNSVLKKSKDKEKTLNNIIKQLQIRYKNANTNSVNLNKQKSILLWEHEKITTQIEALKRNLETDFTKSEANKVFKHVDNYYDLKHKQIILKTNIIFINEFLKRYNYLNNYNKLLLDILINNKDIISKNSYIVIPDSWSTLLKEFNLIYSESEYKEKIKK